MNSLNQGVFDCTKIALLLYTTFRMTILYFYRELYELVLAKACSSVQKLRYNLILL